MRPRVLRGFAALLWCCVAAPASASETGPVDPVLVYYSGGDCGTDAIAIEVFDRKARAWIAHPAHPRIPVPSCQTEDAGILLNELRWRCGVEGAPWRNLAIFDPEVLSHCVLERILEGERQRIRDAQRERIRDGHRERQRIREVQRKRLELEAETEEVGEAQVDSR